MSEGVGDAIEGAVADAEDHAAAAAAHAATAEHAATEAALASVAASTAMPDASSDLAAHLSHAERITELEGQNTWLREQLMEQGHQVLTLMERLTPPALAEAIAEATETTAQTETLAETETANSLSEIEVDAPEAPIIEAPETVAEIVASPVAVVQKAKRSFRLI